MSEQQPPQPESRSAQSPATPGPTGAPPGYYSYPRQPYPASLAPFNTYAILAAIFAFAVFPPLGIYFGTKAKQQIVQTGERGIELAQAGVIGGWVLSGLFGVFLILWCGMFITFFGAVFGVLGASTL